MPSQSNVENNLQLSVYHLGLLNRWPKLKDENPSERGAKARDYIVLLLYDLQEKIEGAIESGKVTSEEGALAIDKIVAIKELILQGKSKDEIRPLLVDLRTTIGTLREDIDNE